MRTVEVIGKRLSVEESDATCWSPDGGHRDFWDAFAADEYEPGTVKRMRKLLRPGSLFMDVGAWIGPFTLLALSLGAKVCAFEPDPVAFAELDANIGLNEGDAVLFNAALVPDDNQAHYALSREDGKGLSALAACDESDLPMISMARVMTLLGMWGVEFPEKPTFVKVDVEGFEGTLMPSLGPWCSRRKVPMQISLHGKRFPAESLAGYPTVIWPKDDHGDVVALPFVIMDPRPWT